MERTRRSAKDVIHLLANEILQRVGDPDRAAKLVVIETIALKCGWNELYDRLRFKSNLHTQPPAEEPRPKRKPWWIEE